MRKLATVRKIDEIKEHTNADALELAIVGGWQVVIRKGDFKAGELAVFLEIDSWVPDELAPFLSKGKVPREYNGVPGERLRTVRLRNELSQGLLIKFTPEIAIKCGYIEGDCNFISRRLMEEERDIAEHLNIQKWEAPIPANMAGQMKGNFPSYIPKTDQERWQNLKGKIQQHIDDETLFEITQKMDGSSITVACKLTDDSEEPITAHVCSRNIDLKLVQEGNIFVDTAFKTGLVQTLTNYCVTNNVSLAIQGELVGPGIQGNPEDFANVYIFVFDVFDIDKQEYFTPAQREEFLLNDIRPETHGIFLTPHVNSIYESDLGYDFNYDMKRLFTMEELGINKPEDLLWYSELTSMNGNPMEGVVFKSEDGKFSFKAIANSYLEKHDG